MKLERVFTKSKIVEPFGKIPGNLTRRVLWRASALGLEASALPTQVGKHFGFMYVHK